MSAEALVDIRLERHGIGDDEKQYMVVTGKTARLGMAETRIEVDDAALDIRYADPGESYQGADLRRFDVTLRMTSPSVTIDKIDGVPQREPKEPDVKQSVFQRVKHRDVKGWHYAGGPVSDDIILDLAKHGVLISYWSTEDNEWEGEFVRIIANGEQKDFPADSWIVFDTWRDSQWQFDNCNRRWEYDVPMAPDSETPKVTLKDALDALHREQ